MHPPHLFRMISDALFRPACFAAALDDGRRAQILGVVAALEVLGVVDGFLVLVLGQLVPLGRANVLWALLIAPLVALLLASLLIPLGAGNGAGSATFWLLRTLIAAAPPLALFLGIVFSDTYAWLQQTPLSALGLLALLGSLLSGGLSVVLVLGRVQEARNVRLVLAAGALLVAVLLGWSPPLRQTTALLVAAFGLGLALGFLRMLSYLWQAPLSLVLAIAALLGAPPLRLLRAHPVGYDDLCLLPLPGLAPLLVRASASDPAAGGAWLLRVAEHPGHRSASVRALVQGVRARRGVHALLFWLSTRPEGAALLRHACDHLLHPHPLLVAYAAFAHVATPEAWGLVAERQRSALRATAQDAEGLAVLALIEAAAHTLRADRWNAVSLQLFAPTPPLGLGLDALGTALSTLQRWAAQELPTLAASPALVPQIEAGLADLEGWPAALLATMSEHLLFLAQIERRRGAWPP